MTSDLNDLYRRVINRNNRLVAGDLGAPEMIVNNEKRMLQEAVDGLCRQRSSWRRGHGHGNRAPKSLSDMLKGKQSFRQRPARQARRARSVIVVGPPKLRMRPAQHTALQLFKPFVIKRPIDLSHAQNIKAAKAHLVERSRPQAWYVLEEARAPRREPRAHAALPPRHPTLRAAARRGQGHPPAPLVSFQRRLRRLRDGRAPAAVGRGPGRGRFLMLASEQHPEAVGRSVRLLCLCS